jgi:hypothetical protein
VLAQGEELRVRLGERGRRRVVEVFDIERSFDAFARLF